MPSREVGICAPGRCRWLLGRGNVERFLVGTWARARETLLRFWDVGRCWPGTRSGWRVPEGWCSAGPFRWLYSLLACLWLAQCARTPGPACTRLGEGQLVVAALDGVLEPGLVRPLMSLLWGGQCWLPGSRAPEGSLWPVDGQKQAPGRGRPALGVLLRECRWTECALELFRVACVAPHGRVPASATGCAVPVCPRDTVCLPQPALQAVPRCFGLLPWALPFPSVHAGE